MQDKIILRSYNKINVVEKKIYAIQNLRLPMPINLYAASYFLVISAIIFVLGKVIPFIQEIPPIIRIFIIPFVITKYFRQKKLDGKKPYKFVIDWIVFMFNKNNEYERFKVAEVPKEIRFKNMN